MRLVHKYTNKPVNNIFDENVNVDIIEHVTLVALVFVELINEPGGVELTELLVEL
jgi:hypothetical protein